MSKRRRPKNEPPLPQRKQTALMSPQGSFGKTPNEEESVLLGSLFAGLVSHAARGLASGLAGSLALAATAVLYALCEITGLDGLDTLHIRVLLFCIFNFQHRLL